MSGYTDHTPELEGPDFELARRLASELPVPAIGEGHAYIPGETAKVLNMGAWTVVVGGVITWPLEVTEWSMKTANGRWGQKINREN